MYYVNYAFERNLICFFLEFSTAATVFALMRKMAISGSFAIVYNYSAEVYPTCVR